VRLVDKILLISHHIKMSRVNVYVSPRRGREEVLPVRFETKKTGKAGYAPARAKQRPKERPLFLRGGGSTPAGHCRWQRATRSGSAEVRRKLFAQSLEASASLRALAIERGQPNLFPVDFRKESVPIGSLFDVMRTQTG
jgi:hypothetical protein